MKDKLEKIRVLNKKQRHVNDCFMLEYSKICMIDFTSWYFILKHFKLEQFNIISFFLFFVESDPDVFHLPWLPQI